MLSVPNIVTTQLGQDAKHCMLFQALQAPQRDTGSAKADVLRKNGYATYLRWGRSHQLLILSKTRALDPPLRTCVTRCPCQLLSVQLAGASRAAHDAARPPGRAA